MDDTIRARTGSVALAIGCLSLFGPAFAEEALAADTDQDSTTPGTQTDAAHGTVLGGVTVTDSVIVEGSYRTDKQASPKATAALVDTPRSITVIAHQLIADSNSSTLAEALRTVPGITLGAGEGGNPLGDRPFIRGADSSNSMYLDGARDLASQTRETFDIEQIEIVKGSDSVTNGSANAGGSINIVSKRPTNTRFVQFDGGIGSADYRRVTLDVNQPLAREIGFRLNAMYHDQGVAGRDYVWQQRWGVAPSIKFGMTGPTSLEFDWYHMHSTELPDSGIPYATVLGNQPTANAQTAPLGTAPLTALNGTVVQRARGTFYGLVDRDFRTTDNDDVSGRLEHRFDNGWVFSDLLRYNRNTQDYLYTLPDNSAGNIYSYGTLTRRVNSRYSWQSGVVEQANLAGHLTTGALDHHIAASLEYDWESSRFGTLTSNPATNAAITGGTSGVCNPAAATQPATNVDYNCTSAGTPNPLDPWTGTISQGLPIYRTLANETTLAASLFDTVNIGRQWVLTLGGRFDHYVTHASGAGTPTTGRVWQGVVADVFTYQAGLAYKPAPNGTIYVSTSSAAIPPGSFLAQGSETDSLTNLTASSQISADDLKVQRTVSYEAGTKWDLFHGALAITADVFQTRTTNSRVTGADGLSVSFVGLQRIRGVELGISGNVTPNWSVFGGYTYMKSVVLNGGTTATAGTNAAGVAASYYAPTANTGKPLPNTPENSATLFTTYKVTPAFTLGGGAMYMGKVYGGFSDSRSYAAGVFQILKTRATYVPGYVRLDANASYKLNGFATLKLSALNLTNKLYYSEAYATHYALQAPGRTVIGTLSLRY
jgi:catecholate siderophore receptor